MKSLKIRRFFNGSTKEEPEFNRILLDRSADSPRFKTSDVFTNYYVNS